MPLELFSDSQEAGIQVPEICKKTLHLCRSPECFDFLSVSPRDENGLLRHYFPLLEGCGCLLLFLKMSFTFFNEVIS